MVDEDLLRLLEEGLGESVRTLVRRSKEGKISAAEIAQLRAMARDAGMVLSFNGKPTPVGDDVLESLKDVDPDLLN